MAGYNLGGYSSDLTLDDYNSALANAGSDFQLEQPQLGATAQPAMQEASAQPQVTAPAPTEQWKPPEKEQNNNMLSKVLGLVGGIMSGGAGAVLGGISQASKK